MQITNANKRGRSFLEWWKLSFLFWFQGSSLCFKQMIFGTENKTQDFPSLSLTWDILCGTFQRREKAELESPWTKHKRSMGHFPFCIERHPQPAKTFCAAPNPLGTLRTHPAVKTLGITKHQICTQSLGRNLQPCSWVFYRIFPTLTGDRAERRSQITCRGGSMRADARSFMGERGKG